MHANHGIDVIFSDRSHFVVVGVFHLLVDYHYDVDSCWKWALWTLVGAHRKSKARSSPRCLKKKSKLKIIPSKNTHRTHSDICVLLFCTIYTTTYHNKQTNNEADNDDSIPTGLSMDKMSNR